MKKLIFTLPFLLTGCGSVQVIDYKYAIDKPVIVSPIARVGDSQPFNFDKYAKDKREFEGDKKFAIMSSSSSSDRDVGGGYVERTTTTSVSTWGTDNVTSAINKARSEANHYKGQEIIVIDNLTPFNFVHTGIGWVYGAYGMEIGGAVYVLDTKGSKK